MSLGFRIRGASSNVAGIICPLGVIGVTELPNSGWAKAHPAHLLVASLSFEIWKEWTFKSLALQIFVYSGILSTTLHGTFQDLWLSTYSELKECVSGGVCKLCSQYYLFVFQYGVTCKLHLLTFVNKFIEIASNKMHVTWGCFWAYGPIFLR